ncbi:MAG: hypothetical protein JKY51_05730, partial [Opitutaceae bacterium]|nr:hypothetical protein [Opitutaceae bacterium]
MAWLLTRDEKDTGFFSSNYLDYSDAPNSLDTTFRLSEGFLGEANGFLIPNGGLRDYDVYSLGYLWNGTYNFDANNSFWFFNDSWSFVTPNVTIYDSTGVPVSFGFGGDTYN